MIEVQHLSKRYGAVKAIDDLTFSVEKGSVVGFLGPNGAGKSTTLRILAGFLGASGGEVRIGGYDIVDDSVKARRLIGYMAETSPLYPEMRVWEYLRFRAELKGIPRRRRADEVARSLSRARVEEAKDMIIAHLSKGYRQRVGMADALLGSPPLLILDEPTSGLDPNQIRDVRDLIRQLGEAHTVLLSTHILSEVEAVCSRAIVIDEGRLVTQGPLSEIRTSGSAELTMVLSGKRRVARDLLRAMPLVSAVETARSPAEKGVFQCRISLDPGIVERDDHGTPRLGPATEAMVRELVAAGLGVREISPQSTSLEQVFAQLTGHARSDQERERAEQ